MGVSTGRRVVISGVGAVSALGVGCTPLWEGLVAGRCGLRTPTRLDLSGFSGAFAGEVPDFAIKDHVPKSYRKATKVMARDIELAVAAAGAAVADAGLVTRVHAEEGRTTPTYPGERTGCHIGAGLIAAETLELTMALASAAKDGRVDLREWGTIGEPAPAGGMNNLPPLWMLKYLPNMLACHVTILHGAEGPSNTITCGESSGLLSLGESRRVIERGDADICFSGGGESKLSHMGVLRAQLAGRLARTAGLEPGAAVRPYDESGTGTLVGEGGGILVVEEERSAMARGARVYARVAGVGVAQSTGVGLPPLERAARSRPNEGLARAARAALRDAGMEPGDIDAIVPQATGIPEVDLPELLALREVIGARLAQIPLVTLSPMLGDAAAGQGALQAVVGAMCLREQRVPARLHGGSPAAGACCGQGPSEARTLRAVLVVCGSITGQNAAVVLSRAG